MTTLIERLRKAYPAELPREAADEIERNINTIVRLAEEISTLKRENEELRSELSEVNDLLSSVLARPLRSENATIVVEGATKNEFA